MDGILNEMLKHTGYKFKTAILKLFNLVLRVVYFPDLKSEGLISHIFKSGDKSDPQNYCGTSINSCVGKVRWKKKRWRQELIQACLVNKYGRNAVKRIIFYM